MSIANWKPPCAGKPGARLSYSDCIGREPGTATCFSHYLGFLLLIYTALWLIWG
jgi:hypothetical protein